MGLFSRIFNYFVPGMKSPSEDLGPRTRKSRRNDDPELEAKVAELEAQTRRILSGRASLMKSTNGHWFVLPFVNEKMFGSKGESIRRKAARHLAFERRIPELKAEQDELQRQADEHNRSLGKPAGRK